MEVVTPYLKYFLYFFAICGFLWTNKIFIRDPKLRAWIMQAFESEDGRANSKLIAAFICVIAILIGWFVAIHFSPNHTAPDYYLYTIAALIGGVYGIKEMGKVLNTKYSNGSGIGGNGTNGNSNGSSNENGQTSNAQDKKQDASNTPSAD